MAHHNGADPLSRLINLALDLAAANQGVVRSIPASRTRKLL
jgi:hypothetical protein